MFRQKKKNRAWIFAPVIALMLVAAFLLILPVMSHNDNGGPAGKHEQEEPKYSTEDSRKAKPAANPAPALENAENQNKQSYYLLKSDNNSIKIFFSDKTGQLIELETTDILYETLSETDQERLTEGIKAGNREELEMLLMDYEG